jgi:hypothetical protein
MCLLSETPHQGLVKFTGDSRPKTIPLEIYAKPQNDGNLIPLTQGVMTFNV